jgi:hypothetical protein
MRRLMSAGKVKTGAPVSFTVTLKLPLALLFEPSSAEQLTVVVPNGKVLPEASAQLTATAPDTTSVADAEYVTAAPAGLVAATVISDGKERAGAVVSTTVTFPEAVAVNPPLSVTVQDTVVAPTGRREPSAGVQFTDGVPSSASLALPIALNASVQPPRVLASMLTLFTATVGAEFGMTL